MKASPPCILTLCASIFLALPGHSQDQAPQKAEAEKQVEKKPSQANPSPDRPTPEVSKKPEKAAKPEAGARPDLDEFRQQMRARMSEVQKLREAGKHKEAEEKMAEGRKQMEAMRSRFQGRDAFRGPGGPPFFPPRGGMRPPMADAKPPTQKPDERKPDERKPDERKPGDQAEAKPDQKAAPPVRRAPEGSPRKGAPPRFHPGHRFAHPGMIGRGYPYGYRYGRSHGFGGPDLRRFPSAPPRGYGAPPAYRGFYGGVVRPPLFRGYGSPRLPFFRGPVPSYRGGPPHLGSGHRAWSGDRRQEDHRAEKPRQGKHGRKAKGKRGDRKDSRTSPKKDRKGKKKNS